MSDNGGWCPWCRFDDSHDDELTTLDMMPHASLIHSTARHNTVYVRMVEQIGSPRMEDGSHASKHVR